MASPPGTRSRLRFAPHRWPVAVLAVGLAGCAANAEPIALVATTSTTVPLTTPTTAPRPVATAPASCPKFTRQRDGEGTTQAPVRELSGLATGRVNPGLLWAHNDSGDSARIFAIEPSGKVVTEARLGGVVALDFEDIAIANGADGAPVLLVADTGDNFHLRPRVSLYRVREPLLGEAPLTKLTLSDVNRTDVRYPDGAQDVEAVAIDPDTGDVLLVSKDLRDADKVNVYLVPAARLVPGTTTVAEKIATIVGRAEASVGPTAADISADGRLVLVKNPAEAYLWLRAPGQSLAEMFASQPQAPCTMKLGPGEAAAFTPDAGTIFTAPEGVAKPIRRYLRS